MAKGNMIIGNGRGKVGNVVFSELHGQQITRVYQPNVTNPKTNGQMLQRARFADAVKFYQRAMGNFYAFAFEDKKRTESDYNAFMRHNIQNAVPLSYARYLSVKWPALGNNWEMSHGSLAITIEPNFGGNGGNLVIPLTSQPSADTVGAVSKVLLQMGAEEGDIFTLVLITQSMDKTAIDLASDNEKAPGWSVLQFIVNSSSTQELQNVATKGQESARSGFYLKSSTSGLEIFDQHVVNAGTRGNYNLAWASVIITRRTASGGLKCSTSYLWPNDDAMDLLDTCLADTAISAAVSSWKNKTTTTNVSEVILKGGIADGETSGSVALGTDSDENGRITSVDGKESLPVSGSHVTSGTNINVQIEGVNLDKIAFTADNAVINSVTFNNLFTAGVLSYQVVNGDESYKIYANGVEFISYTPADVQTVNGSSAPATINIALDAVSDVVVKGTNLNNYSKSDVVVNGCVKKSSILIAEDGKTMDIYITTRAAAKNGETGTVYLRDTLLANVTAHADITISSSSPSTATVESTTAKSETVTLAGKGLQYLKASDFAVTGGIAVSGYKSESTGESATLSLTITGAGGSGTLSYGGKTLYTLTVENENV